MGTGGTSPFGHSGYHPGGIRVGGESRNRSAVKVAGERRYRGYRTDVKVGVRQFELALRRLRQLSSKNEGVPDELDLDETVDETAGNAGRLSLVWRKPPQERRQGRCCCMDVGGSMIPYIRLCSQLFSAVNSQTHFKDLRTFYFHNCVYDWLYLDTDMSAHDAVSTNRVIQELSGDYKLIVVGDAAMAPSELLSRHGIIWWGHSNDEPGIEWLRQLRRHFDHCGLAQHDPRGPMGLGLRQSHDRHDPRGVPHARAVARRPAGGGQEADGGEVDDRRAHGGRRSASGERAQEWAPCLARLRSTFPLPIAVSEGLYDDGRGAGVKVTVQPLKPPTTSSTWV